MTETGTIRRVSPRRPTELPPDVLADLREAKTAADAAQRHFRFRVRHAVDIGSVRSVAAALGLSPTTVQKWVHEDD